MKLTNIRIDNNFVIFDDKKFFRSSIDKGEYEKYIKIFQNQSFILKLFILKKNK